MKKIFFIIGVLFLFSSTFAQNKTVAFSPSLGLVTSTTPVISVSGTDTSFSNAFVLAPVVSLFHKAIGLRYTPFYVANKKQSGFYMHTLTAAFEQYEKENYTLAVDYTRFFFSHNSSVPYSPVHNELYASAGYKKWWLQPVSSAGIGFGKDTSGNTVADVTIAAGINHSFSWDANGFISSMEIDPSLMLNAGTNRYYSFLSTSKYITQNKDFKNYVKSQVGKGKSLSTGGGNNGVGRGQGTTSNSTGSSTGTTEVVKQNFHLSNLELGFYSCFSVGNFKIIPSGSLFFPVEGGNKISGYWQFQWNYNF